MLIFFCLILFENLNNFFKKKNLFWLDYVYFMKFKVRLILVLNLCFLNVYKVFLMGVIDMLLSCLIFLFLLVGLMELFIYWGVKVGLFKVKNYVLLCVG